MGCDAVESSMQYVNLRCVVWIWVSNSRVIEGKLILICTRMMRPSERFPVWTPSALVMLLHSGLSAHGLARVLESDSAALGN